MKKYINTLLLLVSILMQFFLVAQITSKTTKGGQTVGSEIVTFQSKINNTNYKLFVSLPEGYDDKKNKDKVYTFFFTVDGQWNLINVTNAYGNLHYDQQVTDIIIVGITYDGENPDYEKLRQVDYTPTHLSFLKGSWWC